MKFKFIFDSWKVILLWGRKTKFAKDGTKDS